MSDSTEPTAALRQGDGRRRAGDLVPGSMRRIGLRHAVVVEPVRARVLDVNQLRLELQQVTGQLARARAAVAQLDQHRVTLETRIAEFEAASIDRVEGDPEVPLEPPVDPREGLTQPEPAPTEPAPPTEPSGGRKKR